MNRSSTSEWFDHGIFQLSIANTPSFYQMYPQIWHWSVRVLHPCVWSGKIQKSALGDDVSGLFKLVLCIR